MTSTLEMLREVRTRSDIPAFLKAQGLTTRIAEVGVRYGYNFEQLLSCGPMEAFAIDHWRVTGKKSEQDTDLTQTQLDDIYIAVVARNLHRPNVCVVRAASSQAVALLPLCSLDYVYIDADHTKDGSLADMLLWWKRIRQGGILGGHDYIKLKARNGVSFGVIEAVDEFMDFFKISAECLHITKPGFRSWFVYKEDGE